MIPRVFGYWRTQLVLALALMLVGFGFVMQLRSFERLTERLESESEADLVEIIDGLNGDIDEIRGELSAERLKLMEYRNSNMDGQTMLTQATQEIADLARFVGETEGIGQGITIEIENEESLLVGLDIRQIVEELRASGAWAISVNGRRLAHSSSLWRRSGTLYLDGQPLTPKLKIEALGPSELLFQTITLPRGIRDKLETLKGVLVTVREQPSLRLKPVKGKVGKALAQPVDPTIKQ